jgi:hypothetical protein
VAALDLRGYGGRRHQLTPDHSYDAVNPFSRHAGTAWREHPANLRNRSKSASPHAHRSDTSIEDRVLTPLAAFRDLGLREVKIEKKRFQWLKKRAQTAKSSKLEFHPIQWKLPPIVQMSLQFIRTLRNGIIARMRWLAVLPWFAAMLNSYL